MLTSTAVVGTLRAGETAFWPTVWLIVGIEKGIFLFETKPWLVFLGFIKDLLGMMAMVGAVWSAVVVVGLCENKDVVAATERVFEDGGGTEVDIGIVTGGLICGRTIEVPNAELADVGNLLANGLISRYGK